MQQPPPRARGRQRRSWGGDMARRPWKMKGECSFFLGGGRLNFRMLYKSFWLVAFPGACLLFQKAPLTCHHETAALQ